MAKKLQTIRIDRAKWLTPDTVCDENGDYGDVAGLYNEGKMCCLGFAANQLGAPISKLSKWCGMPYHLGEPWTDARINRSIDTESWTYETLGGNKKKVPKWLRNPLFWEEWSFESPKDRAAAAIRKKKLNLLADINDNTSLAPKVREAKIKKGFEKLGWRAVFHGRYPAKKKVLPPNS